MPICLDIHSRETILLLSLIQLYYPPLLDKNTSCIRLLRTLAPDGARGYQGITYTHKMSLPVSSAAECFRRYGFSDTWEFLRLVTPHAIKSTLDDLDGDDVRDFIGIDEHRLLLAPGGENAARILAKQEPGKYLVISDIPGKYIEEDGTVNLRWE